MSKKKYDPYVDVTARVLEEMEKGAVPWVRPWVSRLGGQQNGLSQRNYTGLNALVLSMVADTEGFKSPYWLTAKKAFALGLELPKGSRGVKVLGWFKARGKAESGSDDDQNSDKKEFLMCRAWAVFNFDQFTIPDGVKLPSHLMGSSDDLKVIDFNPHEAAEDLIAQTGADIDLNASAAYYIPKRDKIFLPPPTKFFGVDEFYSTLFHELTHWTGHEARLNRFKTKNCTRFASKDYSKEELTAEMGSVFICSKLGISTDSQVRNSAAYLRGWMKYLKDHPKEFAMACQRAQRACDFVFSMEAKALGRVGA